MSDTPKDNVIPFKPRLVKSPEPEKAVSVQQPAIVEILQRLLSDALAGQVQGLAVVYLDDDKGVRISSAAYSYSDVVSLIGGMSHLTHCLNKRTE